MTCNLGLAAGLSQASVRPVQPGEAMRHDPALVDTGVKLILPMRLIWPSARLATQHQSKLAL